MRKLGLAAEDIDQVIWAPDSTAILRRVHVARIGNRKKIQNRMILSGAIGIDREPAREREVKLREEESERMYTC